MNLIESYNDIDEENRLQSSLARSVEYMTTIGVIEKYITNASRCIDIGCGVGIYSLFMARKGIKTIAVDLVPNHINRLVDLAHEASVELETYVGTALDLSKFDSDCFDITLCLGPLYHLLDRDDQLTCIQECKRVTKKNGILLFAYMSPYSVFPCAIRGDITRMSLPLIGKIIDDHCIDAESPYCFWTDTYFHDPSEAEKLITESGLTIIDHLATDGQSIAFQDVINHMNQDEFTMWMQYHLKICRNRTILGASNHGLVVAKKVNV